MAVVTIYSNVTRFYDFALCNFFKPIGATCVKYVLLWTIGRATDSSKQMHETDGPVFNNVLICFLV